MMLTLTPAYGRDYTSRAKALKALLDGSDFLINDISSPWDGKPCSARDLAGQTVKIRYDRLRKVFIHKL